MVALVACETLLIVLLMLLVAGLLRSHAAILRRLGPPSADRAEEASPLPAAGHRAGALEASDVAGATPSGDALQIALRAGSPPTLLGFLSTDCGVCERFWTDLQSGRRPPELPPQVRVVVVVGDESPSRLRALQPASVPVVVSSAAWRDYAVPGAPYFVYVEGGHVNGEGSATGWRQISSLLHDAIEDHRGANGGEHRADEAERALAAAGIRPDDPSLYPDGRPSGAR